jgi:pyruvate/2-oxoglutarate dehydrogenase complex dihydrolipoamide dehydrogenase (E3) component
MLERSSKFLPREDSDAAFLLQEQLTKDGININLNSAPTKFELVQPAREEGGYPIIRVHYT